MNLNPISVVRNRLHRFRTRERHVVYTPGTSTGRKTVWIFSYTGVSNEPRVIRQAAAMVNAGWRVVVLGYNGHSPRPVEWHFALLPANHAFSVQVHYALLASRRIALWLSRARQFPSIRSWAARLHHAHTATYRLIATEVRRFRNQHRDLKPDLVVSHDYFTADVGYETARWAKARFVIDCHEYARGQYMHDPVWVRQIRPYIAAFQDYFLERADGVTTVCDGIAALLNSEQVLRRPVEVVRSVPFRSIQPFRPAGARITVLYLGGIYYVRGLHKAVKSLPLWRPEFDLVLRGDGDGGYIQSLSELAAELGVTNRLRIEPPVPFNDIVPSANAADIGYFVHKDVSPQKRFVLPNKYFEYIMAGLALCVSDLPEMARLVRQYDNGKLVPGYDEQTIADVINSFDRPAIDAMKQNSLKAAEELNWDSEQRRMLAFYDRLG